MYLLFVFDDYYPGGAQSQFVDSFDSVQAAQAHYDQSGMDNFNIFNTQTGEWE